MNADTGVEETVEVVELLIEPTPPDTADSLREELPRLVEEALREAGQEHLQVTGELEFQIEKTLPIDWIEVSRLTTAAALAAIFKLAGDMALEVFKRLVLPRLEQHAKVREKRWSRVSRRRKR